MKNLLKVLVLLVGTVVGIPIALIGFLSGYVAAAWIAGWDGSTVFYRWLRKD